MMRLPKILEAVKNHPIVFGHRGFKAAFPENTFEAFDACVTFGIPAIELDVQICASGEPVVVHDFDLKRTGGLNAAVKETNFSEIRKLDAGLWFHKDFSGARIPLFEDLVIRYKDTLIFDIELKSREKDNTVLVQKVVEIIKRHQIEEQCIVSSFNPYLLRQVKELYPILDCGIIYSSDKEVPSILRHGAGRFFFKGDFIKPYHGKINVLQHFLLNSLEHYPVFTWTVDDTVDALRLRKLGVFGMASNNAVIMQQFLHH